MSEAKGMTISRFAAQAILIFCLGFFCGRGWESRAPLLSTLPEKETAEQKNTPEAPRVVNAPQTPPASVAGERAAPVTQEGESSAPPPPAVVAEPQTPPPDAAPLPSVQPEIPLPPPAAVAGAPATPPRALSPVLHDGTPFEPSLSSVTPHKLGTGNGPTLLVVGGIQGDEPGGFSAASVLATQYRITSGSVWVVPGLNLRSILQRNRGVFGDMNRKFAAIAPDDPELPLVNAIKDIIMRDDVSMVLNLHDGSGFYRPVYEDKLRNPKRWGQSLIIDQEDMEAPHFYRLLETAQAVEREVNSRLLSPEHRYHIHNTRTAEGNEQMEKTLSWFSVRNGKPAFGIEASKEFGTDTRAYYHLQIIEAYMRLMGIGYERDFELTPQGILTALNSDLKVVAYDNRLVLDLENVRPNLALVPFKKGRTPDQRSSKPLLALMPEERAGSWRVAYGNRTLTRLNPDFMDFDDSLTAVEMLVDGKPKTIRLGEVVAVRDSFLVKGQEGYRVNAIGAQKEVNGTEADVLLVRKDFLPRFSVDKGAMTYRVEVYKGKAFAGMLLVRFGESGITEDVPLTATSGPESELGF